MKKHILALIFIAIAVHGFAEGFDDMAYSNPDFMTYFQQEMSSLMQFQFENDINIPFFLSASYRYTDLPYKSNYLQSLHPDGLPRKAALFSGKGDFAFDITGGFQIRLNRALYLALLGGYSIAMCESYIDDVWTDMWESNGIWIDGVEQGEYYKLPMAMRAGRMSYFLGGGLSLNTSIVKGGMYLGYGYTGRENINMNDWKEVRIPHKNGDVDIENRYGPDYAKPDDRGSLKIAIVPLFDTSGMKYIGAALNYILGFFDMGDAVMTASEDKGDAKTDAFVNTFNAGLNFAFNRIHFDPIALQARAIYTRNSFDTAARANTYGLNVQGRLSRFPLGFTLESGYKQFYALPQYYERYYGNGTGYFNGSVYFPLKKITLGVIYGYDTIYQSKITFALSTNFLSGFYSFNPISPAEKDIYFGGVSFDSGVRYRHGGWKAGKEQ